MTSGPHPGPLALPWPGGISPVTTTAVPRLLMITRKSSKTHCSRVGTPQIGGVRLLMVFRTLYAAAAA